MYTAWDNKTVCPNDELEIIDIEDIRIVTEGTSLTSIGYQYRETGCSPI